MVENRAAEKIWMIQLRYFIETSRVQQEQKHKRQVRTAGIVYKANDYSYFTDVGVPMYVSFLSSCSVIGAQWRQYCALDAHRERTNARNKCFCFN